MIKRSKKSQADANISHHADKYGGVSVRHTAFFNSRLDVQKNSGLSLKDMNLRGP